MSAVISSALICSESNLAQPLNHARIGYKSILTASNITVSSQATDFPGIAVVNPATYERWKPTAIPATLTVDAGDSVDVDYIGIAAHTIGSSECAVKVSYSFDSSSWVDIDEAKPGDNSTIMMIFGKTSARYWRLTISGSTIPLIGVVKIGEALSMQRPIYSGHSPINLNRVTAVRPNISEKGQWLGSSIERQGFSTSFSWQHLKAEWYRKNFDKFASSNPRAHPFFIAWRPLKYPNEVGYCWSTSDIKPQNMGIIDYMSVSMSVEGYQGD